MRTLTSLCTAVVLLVLVVASSLRAQQPACTFPQDTLILGSDAPEMRFFADVGEIGPACVGPVSGHDKLRAISLPDAGDGVEFYLATVPLGRYQFIKARYEDELVCLTVEVD